MPWTARSSTSTPTARATPTPASAGWGAILIARSGTTPRRELSGADEATTNNRMELTAAVRALEALKCPCTVVLTTDSQYLRRAFTDRWLAKWQRNGWRTATTQPVANADLWQRLAELAAEHEMTFRWVRGHAADPLNNRCDGLAVAARRELARRLGVRKGSG